MGVQEKLVMKKVLFKEAVFVKTAIAPKDYPLLRKDNGEIMSEIAVVGRSNVGKSSLLNFLFNTRSLVKTSSEPGKTRALNFFTLDKQLCFVDLPGYGYAAAGKEEQKEWAKSIETYLQERQELKLFLFLLDIRRVPNEGDFQMLEYFLSTGLPFILVFTKVDKVSLSEREMRTKAILDSFGVDVPFVHTSSTKKVGRGELARLILESLEIE